MAALWQGWLEKRGRSSFSKIDHRYFILRRGAKGGSVPSNGYGLEYFAAPTSSKADLVGSVVVGDPVAMGFARRGCLNVAVSCLHDLCDRGASQGFEYPLPRATMPVPFSLSLSLLAGNLRHFRYRERSADSDPSQDV